MGGTSRPRPRSSTFDPYSRRPPSEIAANISTADQETFSYRSPHHATARRGRKRLPWQTSNSFGAQNLPANRSAWILLVCRRERASSRDWATVKPVKLIRQFKTHFNDALIAERYFAEWSQIVKQQFE
jgi:hypothetical protein